MSNIQLIIEERAASIGSFLVGRLLPFRQKRMVPHIGLSTLTFLFEGSIMHRDSLGNEVEIKPGAVNWMTAGKGIVHSERTPEYLRHSEKEIHGLQVWVALPKDLEQMDPEFFHIDSSEIPAWSEGDIQFKLIAGLYILEGNIESEGNTFEPKHILIAKDSSLCEFVMEANTTIYIFGGEPLPEVRFIDWNFVGSSKEIISEAREKWIAQDFPKIKGDENEFVPYPSALNQ